MRQHVNPLSSNFNQIERIPSLNEMFGDSKLNLHLDIGCAAGEFLFDLALINTSWNYLGIEIREKLVKNAKLKVLEREIKNLYFIFGNANNILNDVQTKFIFKNLKSYGLFRGFKNANFCGSFPCNICTETILGDLIISHRTLLLLKL